jgi:hypothetical protein
VASASVFRYLAYFGGARRGSGRLMESAAARMALILEAREGRHDSAPPGGHRTVTERCGRPRVASVVPS